MLVVSAQVNRFLYKPDEMPLINDKPSHRLARRHQRSGASRGGQARRLIDDHGAVLVRRVVDDDAQVCHLLADPAAQAGRMAVQEGVLGAVQSVAVLFPPWLGSGILYLVENFRNGDKGKAREYSEGKGRGKSYKGAVW